MNEKVVQAIVDLLERGGADAAELGRLYFWLNSSVMKQVLVSGSIVILFAIIGIVCWHLISRNTVKRCKHCREHIDNCNCPRGIRHE